MMAIFRMMITYPSWWQSSGWWYLTHHDGNLQYDENLPIMMAIFRMMITYPSWWLFSEWWKLTHHDGNLQDDECVGPRTTGCRIAPKTQNKPSWTKSGTGCYDFDQALSQQLWFWQGVLHITLILNALTALILILKGCYPRQPWFDWPLSRTVLILTRRYPNSSDFDCALYPDSYKIFKYQK